MHVCVHIYNKKSSLILFKFDLFRTIFNYFYIILYQNNDFRLRDHEYPLNVRNENMYHHL